MTPIRLRFITVLTYISCILRPTDSVCREQRSDRTRYQEDVSQFSLIHINAKSAVLVRPSARLEALSRAPHLPTPRLD
ncbi:hypothetical protein AFLA_010058 [Aspergillus flavus NRRL3357]|nr:hypothetical protein AFLA_010058 [Aspergillus flavus NRRL3357]